MPYDQRTVQSFENPRLASICVAAAIVFLAFPAGLSAAGQRETFDVDVFARVPDPGSPEGIAISSRKRVFVGTSPKEGGPLGKRRPSKIFAYNRRGVPKREWVVEGQDLDNPFYGLVGMAFDGRDRLYAADVAPARLLRLNPRTGRQRTFARFRDVPPCSEVKRRSNCSETEMDMPPLPDYPVFHRSGAMYVTDLNQALIWKVPPKGGRARVWFTDPGFESLFGLNGIQFTADGRTLMFVLSTEGNPISGPPQTPAGLYTVRIRGNGRAGTAKLFWASRFSDVPDGLAIARSGNVYVPLAGTPFGNAVAVVSPQGQETARVPASPVENALMEIPFDQPASAAFLGRRVLVTNHALFSKNPEHFAVLEIFAAERGLPLYRP